MREGIEKRDRHARIEMHELFVLRMVMGLTCLVFDHCREIYLSTRNLKIEKHQNKGFIDLISTIIRVWNKYWSHKTHLLHHHLHLSIYIFIAYFDNKTIKVFDISDIYTNFFVLHKMNNPRSKFSGTLVFSKYFSKSLSLIKSISAFSFSISFFFFSIPSFSPLCFFC